VQKVISVHVCWFIRFDTRQLDRNLSRYFEHASTQQTWYQITLQQFDSKAANTGASLKTITGLFDQTFFDAHSNSS